MRGTTNIIIIAKLFFFRLIFNVKKYTPAHIYMQALKDWHLALGVLTLVLIDIAILLVYMSVEGAQGKHTATRVGNRENPSDVEGVR